MVSIINAISIYKIYYRKNFHLLLRRVLNYIALYSNTFISQQKSSYQLFSENFIYWA